MERASVTGDSSIFEGLNGMRCGACGTRWEPEKHIATSEQKKIPRLTPTLSLPSHFFENKRREETRKEKKRQEKRRENRKRDKKREERTERETRKEREQEKREEERDKKRERERKERERGERGRERREREEREREDKRERREREEKSKAVCRCPHLRLFFGHYIALLPLSRSHFSLSLSFQVRSFPLLFVPFFFEGWERERGEEERARKGERERKRRKERRKEREKERKRERKKERKKDRERGERGESEREEEEEEKKTKRRGIETLPQVWHTEYLVPSFLWPKKTPAG